MQENNKPSYYGILPANVRYCKQLKPIARLMYADITALCNKSGYCTAKNAYFAEAFEVSERSITRYIKNLEDLEFIFIESKMRPVIIQVLILIKKRILNF